MGKEPLAKDKMLAFMLLLVFVVGLICYSKLLVETEKLEEEIRLNQAKIQDLKAQNKLLLEQLENMTVEGLLGLEEGWKVVAVTATAYAPLDNKSGICADENPNMTAIGVMPGTGVIAVNPDLIPYYSKMVIIGDGWIMEGQALDTGGALKKDAYRIDIFKGSYEDAINFGRQQVIVFFKEA